MELSRLLAGLHLLPRGMAIEEFVMFLLVGEHDFITKSVAIDRLELSRPSLSRYLARHQELYSVEEEIIRLSPTGRQLYQRAFGGGDLIEQAPAEQRPETTK